MNYASWTPLQWGLIIAGSIIAFCIIIGLIVLFLRLLPILIVCAICGAAWQCGTNAVGKTETKHVTVVKEELTRLPTRVQATPKQGRSTKVCYHGTSNCVNVSF